MNDLINLANQLGEKIQQSEEFKNYQTAKQKHDDNAELQLMVGDFNLKKIAVMQEMKKEDEKDEKKLEIMQTEMRDLYREIMENDVMTQYVESKEKLETMVNEIYSIINFYVTGEEPECDSANCANCSGCGK